MTNGNIHSQTASSIIAPASGPHFVAIKCEWTAAILCWCRLHSLWSCWPSLTRCPAWISTWASSTNRSSKRSRQRSRQSLPSTRKTSTTPRSCATFRRSPGVSAGCGSCTGASKHRWWYSARCPTFSRSVQFQVPAIYVNSWLDSWKKVKSTGT